MSSLSAALFFFAKMDIYYIAVIFMTVLIVIPMTFKFKFIWVIEIRIKMLLYESLSCYFLLGDTKQNS